MRQYEMVLIYVAVAVVAAGALVVVMLIPF
jgi:hypothetical protein